MKLIQYKLRDRTLVIWGTNQFLDLFISAFFWPIKGIHGGIYLAVNKLMRELDLDAFDRIEGHSMGGSIGLELSRRTGKPVLAQGPFPIYGFWKDYKVNGRFQVYGKDLVPYLFPWNCFGCRPEFIPREGEGNRLSDHMRY